MRRLFLASIGLLAAIALAGMSNAHEIRPALLDIVERSEGWYEVTWKVPMRGDARLAIQQVLPEGLTRIGEPAGRAVPGAWIERMTFKSDGTALAGGSIGCSASESAARSYQTLPLVPAVTIRSQGQANRPSCCGS